MQEIVQSRIWATARPLAGLLVGLFLYGQSGTVSAETFFPGTTKRFHPGHYMLVPNGANSVANHISKIASNPRFEGISHRYSWAQLETDRDVYDFTPITNDLNLLKAVGKRLVIMVLDKSFHNVVPVPSYLNTAEFAGGWVAIGDQTGADGYVAKRWNPAVSARYRALLTAIGNTFGADPSFEAVKTSETALGIKPVDLPDFSWTAYGTQLALVIDTLDDAYPNTVTFLYMNWAPTSMLAGLAQHARERGVGIGGPDIFPNGKPPAGGVIPAYTYYPQHHGQVPLMNDVQWSNFQAITPFGDTNQLLEFGITELRLNYVCWLWRSDYWPNVLATVSGPVFDGRFPVDPAGVGGTPGMPLTGWLIAPALLLTGAAAIRQLSYTSHAACGQKSLRSKQHPCQSNTA